MKYIAGILGFLIGATAVSGVSMAQVQVQLPEFSISSTPTLDMNGQEEFDYETAFANIDNPLMRDTLRLQYQINLLERLIRRQTEIQRIAESYEGVGIPFDQPAPPQSACNQLPVNILCMAFYPDSAKYKDLIAERREEARRDQMRQMESLLWQMDIAPLPQTDASQGDTGAPVRNVRYTPPPKRPDYVWSDIRCLSGNCSALLENTKNINMRFRIREGEELPGGSRITEISSYGVTVVKNGENYDLKPKGISPREPDLPQQGEISNILRERFGEVPGGAAEPDSNDREDNATADAAIPPQRVTDPGPPQLPLLGPTGLF